MITKNTIIAVLATTIVIDEVLGERMRRKLESTKWKLAQSANLNRYLVDIMEKHDIPLNQFDRIAINDLIGK